MKIERVLLLWGVVLILGGLSGVLFPEMWVKINRSVVPGVLLARMERVIPITPGLIRAWSFVGVLAGVILVIMSMFIRDP